jgi:hypothetical protein
MHGDLGTVASLCAILVTVGGGLRWVYRAVVRVEHAVKVVEGRSTELLPNGGGSLRDDVSLIRQAVDAHSDTLACQDEVLREQGEAIARLAARLETETMPKSDEGG